MLDIYLPILAITVMSIYLSFFVFSSKALMKNHHNKPLRLLLMLSVCMFTYISEGWFLYKVIGLPPSHYVSLNFFVSYQFVLWFFSFSLIILTGFAIGTMYDGESIEPRQIVDDNEDLTVSCGTNKVSHGKSEVFEESNYFDTNKQFTLSEKHYEDIKSLNKNR